MTRRVKSSDVYHVRAKYKAVAECEYRPGDPADARPGDAPRCPWEFTPRGWHKDVDTRREARNHVLLNPGHTVVVVVRDVTRYYLPDALVAELTAATSPADGDDRPANPDDPQED